MFRRLSIDADTKEVIEDVYKADMPDNFSWRAALPGAPRSLMTRYYFYVGGDAAPILDLLKKKESIVDLKAPS